MEFNLPRLSLLLKKDFRNLLLPTLAIISLIFFVITTINILALAFDRNGNHHTFDIFNTFLVMFFISCAIIGALSFEEIKKRAQRIEFLNLPASALEKTSSKLIIAGILFPIAMIILYYVIYGYASSVSSLFGGRLRLNNQPDASQYILYTVGLIITSIFAYGSIKYNNGSFVKIIIWALAFFFAFAAMSFIIAFILFPELRAEIFGWEHNYYVDGSNVDIEEHWIIKFAKRAFYFVPLIFWVLSYFTLKEKEA